LLENLVTRVLPEQTNVLVIKWTEELKLRWTSPLTGGFTKGKLFRVNDLVYEHVMVMWLYAGLLRERAFEMMDRGELLHWLKFNQSPVPVAKVILRSGRCWMKLVQVGAFLMPHASREELGLARGNLRTVFGGFFMDTRPELLSL
jgi:hypothetical protein